MTGKWRIDSPPLGGEDLLSGVMGIRFTEKRSEPSTLSLPRNTRYTAKKLATERLQRLVPEAGNAYNEKPQSNPRTKLHMSEVTKEVLDARLEAIEARMDARVAGMSAKLDATLAEIRSDRGRFTQLETDIREVKLGVAAMSQGVETKLTAAAADTMAQVRGLKSNIWFGVATTIASVLAAMALVFAAFDSGRETSKNISEATARMEKISAQLEAAAKAQMAVPPTPPNSPASQTKP
jgi:hypothetical protein